MSEIQYNNIHYIIFILQTADWDILVNTAVVSIKQTGLFFRVIRVFKVILRLLHQNTFIDAFKHSFLFILQNKKKQITSWI